MIVFKWLRRLYDLTLRLAGHPNAIYWLALISFAESSFFPIPPDVLLLPLCLANRKRAFHYAVVCTVASILGGLFGYGIGHFAFDSAGRPILDFYGVLGKYDLFRQWYAEYGALIVVAAGFSPIPYKVITISSGVFQFSLPAFLALSLVSRGLRFGLECWLVQKFGEPALDIVDRHFNKLTLAAVGLFIGGFLALKVWSP